MSECILLNSGNEADLDVITATASDVVAPKVILNKEGDPIAGTIVDRGNWGGSVSMNGSVTIPAGKHGGLGKVNGPMVTQRGNWTGRIGVNGKIAIPEGYHAGGGYIDQGINDFRGILKPISNVRIANGRFEVAVDEGYYGCYWAGNSYEYLSYAQVLNAIGLTAAKLKKGETVLGMNGTFEGYVPTPTDLYWRGNNVAGFTSNNPETIFESGMIVVESSYSNGSYLQTNKSYNLAGFSRLNIEGNLKTDFYYGNGGFFLLQVISNTGVLFKSKEVFEKHTLYTNLSFDISTWDITSTTIKIGFFGLINPEDRIIRRIWLS